MSYRQPHAFEEFGGVLRMLVPEVRFWSIPSFPVGLEYTV